VLGWSEEIDPTKEKITRWLVACVGIGGRRMRSQDTDAVTGGVRHGVLKELEFLATVSRETQEVAKHGSRGFLVKKH